MRNVTSAIQTVDSPKLAGPGQGDTHLQSMQSLAAHLKLLLDSPEHLWRLMEKKMYLHAAWLFLLSRVVHRSLLKHGADEDDEGWVALSIDISEQFPLVQRQWEAISQFRSQITHKATLSLREPNLTSSEVCAILLALHLLESRPFAEALNTFLSQRTRCLANALARHKERMQNGFSSGPHSSHHVGSAEAPAAKTELRDVRQRSKTVLDIVSRTLGTARTIFLDEDHEPSLMRKVIACLQASTPSSSEELPPEVRLTSQILLSSLPSSNHFLLLPATIKGYKPYVDVDSLSHEKQVRFSQSLAEWFQSAMQTIRTAMSSWFSSLVTIRELWAARAWCRKLIRSSQGLRSDERTSINAAMDAICRSRAEEIWKSVLTSADATFRSHLESALSQLKQPGGSDLPDAQPARYMLQVPPISLASIGRGVGSPFQHYSQSLEQQISGRTPLLQGVLNTVETRMQALRVDLDTMRGQDEDTQSLALQLVEHYRDDADSMCNSICDALQAAASLPQEAQASALQEMVFLARLADELSSSDHLLARIGCSDSATDNFRQRLQVLHEDTLQRWQAHVANKALDDYWNNIPGDTTAHMDENVSVHRPGRPTSAAVGCVLALATSLQQLGGLLDPSRMHTRTQKLLGYFAVKFVERLQQKSDVTDSVKAELVKDLIFLHILVTAASPEDAGIGARLQEAVAKLCSEDLESTRNTMISSVSKMQLLFGLLLPSAPIPAVEKTPDASKTGSSAIEPSSQTALDVVKPSARFGLLLVGSALGR